MATTKLYVHKTCPYAHRALFVAAEKGLVEAGKVEIVEVSLPTPQWYNETVNPRATVPCLQVDLPSESAEQQPSLSNTIPESLPVAEYLDDAFDSKEGVSFVAEDARERADVKVFVSDAAAVISNLYATFRAIGSGDEEAVQSKLADVKGGLQRLEALFTAQQLRSEVKRTNSSNKVSSSGPFLLGSRLSMAEVAFAPFLYRVQYVFDALANVPATELFAGAPSLYRMLQAVEARPGFAKYAPSRDDVVAAYAKRFSIELKK